MQLIDVSNEALGQDPKIFYRLGHITNGSGLWYNPDGQYHGSIHGMFNFCSNSALEMPYDEKIVGWLSACESLDELYNWFTKIDILRLQDYGYRVSCYGAADFRRHSNHWVIKQDRSTLLYQMELGVYVRKFIGIEQK